MSDYFTATSLATPLDRDDVRRLALLSCLELHRVRWRRAYLARDGSRLVNWYQGPDAESVRMVLRQQGSPDTAVWPAEVSPPDDTGPGDSGRLFAIEYGFDSSPDAGDLASKRDMVTAALRDDGRDVVRTLMSARPARLVLIVRGDPDPAITGRLAARGLPASMMWPCKEFEPIPERLFEPADEPAAATRREVPARTSRPDSAHPLFAERHPATNAGEVLDAVIIGAGLSGICALHRLLDMGLDARIYDQAGDVGGVWYWNRYPGARADSEAYTYGFSFSEDILREWDWHELFAGRDELARYLEYVVDRCGLRRHIRLDTRISAARYDAAGRCWTVETASGECVAARYLVAATGTQSVPQLPDLEGIDSFAGESHHTAQWPRAGVDVSGKRVGVVGTGATGVQVIQTIAADVASLAVFQRTPTFCVPQGNRVMSDEDRRRIREDWDDILSACRSSYGGFIHCFDERSGLAVPEREREAMFEDLWRKPGFAFWFANFGDLMMNLEVNGHASDFARKKIRERVADPAVAAKLLPDHPFGSKRVPLENGYYEVYNRDNVRLVDLRESPIVRVTPSGIQTSVETIPLDIIVYATGFDTGTGPLSRIDIRGRDCGTVERKWRDGPKTFLGLLMHGFPNLFIVNGPQNAAALCNAGRCIEHNVDWIERCIRHMQANGLTEIEPTVKAEEDWTRHVEDVADSSVLGAMKESWYFGANTPGKARRAAIYAAGAREFRKHCEAVERDGYAGLEMS